ncbi:hypothetical protein CR513_35220, partial [Mucuna pruriens]
MVVYTKLHLQAAIYVFCYIKKSPTQGLLFPTFLFATKISCIDTQKSITSLYIFLNESLILWHSKKQNIISRSSFKFTHHIAVNSRFHKRTNNTDIDYHEVCQKFQAKLFHLHSVPNSAKSERYSLSGLKGY